MGISYHFDLDETLIMSQTLNVYYSNEVISNHSAVLNVMENNRGSFNYL